MFGLNTLRAALAALAANVLGLAGTVAEVNAHIRQRAALDGTSSAESVTLTLPAEAAAVAQDATSAGDAAAADPTPAMARNGRKRTTAAAVE